MSTQYLLQIPSTDQKANGIETIRDRLQTALEKGIRPRPLPVTRMRRQRIRLEPEMETAIADVGQKHGLSISEAASGLLYGLWLGERQSEASPPPPPTGDIDPFLVGLRPGQKPLAKGAINGLLDRRIVLGEGSTGIGKSRVLVRSALAWLANNRTGKVVICAPSLNVLAQIILNEWAEDPDNLRQQATFVVGRNQFASPDRVEEALGDLPQPHREEVEAWLKSEGAPRSSTIAEAFRALNLPAAWLADDLADLVGGESIGHLRLTPGDRMGERAEAIYSTMIGRAERCRVIFTTQASILADARLRLFGNGFLPDYHCLLIDEAHEVEQMASNILSDGLSVHGMRLRLRQAIRLGQIPHGCKGTIKNLLPQLDEAVDEFQGYKPGERIWFSEENPRIRAIRRHTAKWIPALEKLHKKGFDVGYIGSALAAAKQAVNTDRERNITLRFTGVRSYPIIEATFHSLRGIMEPLWERLDAAGLFSATLFTLSSAGPSSGYIRSALHIPVGRALDLPPANARWALENVTVHLPDPDQCTDLYPPDHEVLEDAVRATPVLAKYHQALAEQLMTVIRAARGGVLVLFTAYRELHGVAEVLREKGLSDRLVEQSRGDTTQAMRKRFLALDRPGIWLGTGASWTGLDLSAADNGAEADLTLTDLVVTRLPLGQDEFGIVAAKLRTMKGLQRVFLDFRLRQGIGRLVRDPGHKDRHIWVLDPRITSTEGHNPWLTTIARRSLAKYPHQAKFRSS
jgi:Rad3-related DNA helicase